MKKLHIAALVLALAFGLSACGGEKVEAPSPAPVETATPTATPTASPEATATPTPTPSPTVEPSPEASPEATAEPTPTAKATPAPTPKASKAPATAAPTPEPTQNAAAETDRPDGWIDENPRTPPPELLEELERQNSQIGTSDTSDFDVEASNRRMEEQAGKMSVENAPVSDMTREESIAAGRHIIE